MTDAPDWQRYPQRAGTPLVSEVTKVWAAGTTSYGGFAVGSWSALSVYHTGMPVNHQVSVNWYADGTYVTELDNTTWSVYGSQGFTEVIPCLTGYCKVTLDNQGTTAATSTLIVTPAAAGPAVNGALGGTRNGPLAVYNGAVAAGATEIQYAATIAAGPATAAFRVFGTGLFNARLTYWDASALAWTYLAEWDSSAWSGGVAARVSLPRATCRIELHNSSTSSETVTMSLVSG